MGERPLDGRHYFNGAPTIETGMFLRVGISSTNTVWYKMIDTEDGSLSGILARMS